MKEELSILELEKALIGFIESNEQDEFSNLLDNRSYLATLTELVSLSSRLIMKTDKKLRLIFLKQLLIVFIQNNTLLTVSGILKIYNSDLSKLDKYVFTNTEDLAYELLKDPIFAGNINYNHVGDVYTIANMIGQLSNRVAQNIWADYDYNRYFTSEMVEKFTILSEAPEAAKPIINLIIELQAYVLLTIVSSYEDHEICESLNYVFKRAGHAKAMMEKEKEEALNQTADEIEDHSTGFVVSVEPDSTVEEMEDLGPKEETNISGPIQELDADVVVHTPTPDEVEDSTPVRVVDIVIDENDKEVNIDNTTIL